MLTVIDPRLNKRFVFNNKLYFHLYESLVTTTKSTISWSDETSLYYFLDRYNTLHHKSSYIAYLNAVDTTFDLAVKNKMITNVIYAARKSANGLPIDLFYIFNGIEDQIDVERRISWKKDLENPDRPNEPSRLMINFLKN